MRFISPIGVISDIWHGLSRGNDRYPFGFSLFNTSTRFNSYSQDREKLNMALSNPAMLKVIKLQCDLFSMGRVTVKVKEKELPDDPFLTLIKNPNPFQVKSQFLWDAMFWEMLGNAYCYIDSRVVDATGGNKMYFLDPSKMVWPLEMQRESDKLIFSGQTLKEMSKKAVRYRYNDGTSFEFSLDKLIVLNDLTNGVGNWLKGPSAVDALTKIISNSEHTLDSKNINTRFSQKFLVGSKTDTGKIGMGEEERNDIRDKIEDTNKRVWPLKADVNIRRFVDDMASLKLDESFLADYFFIGSMYGIPRDVLEANISSTYENQEKATMRHVSYCMEPKGNDLMNRFERHFGYDAEGKDICMSWSHLAFMQVFAKEKTEVDNQKINSLSSLLSLGVPIDQANKFLGTSFVIPPPEKTAQDNSDPATLEAQASLRGSVGGVQGILAVQASVGAGTTSHEAALSILTIIYGFTEQQANDLLGKPEESTANQGGQAF